MTPEQIQKLADGLPPSCMGKDHEEVVVWLAKQHIALQQQVNALAAENTGMDKFVNECLQVAWKAGSLDDADIQEMALKNGLLRKEPYCSDLHENMTDDPGNFEEGDEFFIRVDAPGTDAIKRQWMAEGANDTRQTLSALAKLNNDLYRWTSRMSYNGSWVGEPEGLIKGHIREMEKILDAAQLRQPSRYTSI